MSIDDWPAIDDALLRYALECGVAIESLTGDDAVIQFVPQRSQLEITSRWNKALRDDAFARAFASRIKALPDEEIFKAVDERARWTPGPTLREALEGLPSKRTRGGDGKDDDSTNEDVPPRFGEAEQAILRAAGRARGDGEDMQVVKADAATLRKIAALERSAQAATARLATSRGALAELVGMSATFVITERESVIGRSTEELKVDVDLCEAGNASKISRQQAFLKLRWNGEFALRNVGRRPIWCNNVPLSTGQRCILAPHTLIEVGGMRLLFMPNPTLIRAESPIGA
ncbi:Forkhead-associated (FHA) domain [Ostreococcus tauri]|uniref:Forkhead-associated (FHA) domain n=1 Tax=Ostreococcus tauri TaxID=70448 RepID=A0A096P8K0_OSTTA|nr:Forkhead-associated (FHA) domain [Ostreococcus tauri]OUS44226.1 hypothetical protein BE221DRAFT_78497 [Ostreococcus tauri]CEG00294.1 Forkhead-associated (FHA) domain [Ostreococcus tauri]|eukprot:XP_003083518.2 Forkhead-associated (FHA) domain [Ostreococcus tauri]